jgi:simple sugar transport system substrate-binding protein
MIKHLTTTTALCGAAVALAALASYPAAAEDKLNIVHTHHSSASNPFWQAAKKGFDDACARIAANCQMVFTQTEGSIEQQVANRQAALARKPDALITTSSTIAPFSATSRRRRRRGSSSSLRMSTRLRAPNSSTGKLSSARISCPRDKRPGGA